MKIADRVRAWALRLGIVIDEPAVIIVDGVLLDAMNAGRVDVFVNWRVKPHPRPAPPPVLFPQRQPRGEQ